LERTRAKIGAELFQLVAKAHEAGLDPELELRAAARRYLDKSGPGSDRGMPKAAKKG
jgi:hypothetical protein